MGLKRVNRRWDELAREDPFWAIVSDPAKRGNRWRADEFFRSGRQHVEKTLLRLDELGCRPRPSTALDFGCGAGRLSQALANHFEEVHGVDASPTMIRLAERYNAHPERCSYHHVERPPLPFPAGRFDFVVSELTLQHIPPRAARRYILELIRVLAPGGTLVFQEAADPVLHGVPSGPMVRLSHRIKLSLPRPLFDGLRSLRLALRPPETFEMHGVPRHVVEALIRRVAPGHSTWRRTARPAKAGPASATTSSRTQLHSPAPSPAFLLPEKTSRRARRFLKKPGPLFLLRSSRETLFRAGRGIEEQILAPSAQRAKRKKGNEWELRWDG